MMVDCPSILQELLIEYIAENIDSVCTVRYSNNNDSYKLYFRDSNAFCHQKAANLLLRTLDRKKLLTDLNLTLFDPLVLRLSQVTLHNTENVSRQGLEVLQYHQIQSVETKNLGKGKVSVDELINCFSEWTLNNLRTLNVSGSHFALPQPSQSSSSSSSSNSIFRGNNILTPKSSNISYNHGNILSPKLYLSLSKLKNLNVLNVSGTELASHALLNICSDLTTLTSLDISNCSKLESVECLRLRKDTLKSLNLYNLKVLRMEETKQVLLDLQELVHLDLSENKAVQDPIDRLVPSRPIPIMSELLQHPEFGPNLQSLDISGQDEAKLDDLYFFLRVHPNCHFLGLMLTSLCLDTVFLDSYNIKVTGVARADQLVEALRRYPARKEYVPKILYKIFMLTAHSDTPRPDIIKLILPVMNQHASLSSIQLAGTACLYNLTKGQVGEQVHPHILKEVVHTTLTAMSNFHSYGQLQKNGLLTLCCDRILHEVSFDKYWCARLVLDCLLAFNDPSTDRMAVAICSILAAKISTEQTAMLGAKNTYMRKLLSLVKRRIEEKAVDITLKFTLSALWNLTDESPATCEVFLAEKGLNLFLELLQTFSSDAAVETKVLGLLNNIAEVSPLRGALINKTFVEQLKLLLWSPNVDVSYFAAGIVAHLVCAGQNCWDEPAIARDELLNQLGNVVLSWEQPKEEMVAYRSFQPFIPLLMSLHMYQVQLWAVWALHHVTTKNSKRYCSMLVKEGVYDVLQRLLQQPASNEDVRRLARKMLHHAISPETFTHYQTAPAMDVMNCGI